MTTAACARCRIAVLAVLLAAGALAGTAATASAGQVKAGVGEVDGTYNVGSSAGQYASTRIDNPGTYGDVDPHLQQIKNQASYGVQARERVKALVIRGGDGKLIALVTNSHYVPQDALWRRTAQLAATATGGLVNETNLIMSVSHNHSSPSYSSLDWGVWTFQDVFDFRFFDYYARQNVKAIQKALADLKDARVGGTVSYFDKFQRNPMGPGVADDGTPTSFPKPYTDHDLSVVRFETTGGAPLATLVNIGQHPEFLNGYDLITGEYTGTMERFTERTLGGTTFFTQNATGTSEVERDSYHSIHERELFDHAQYAQMEWGARQLADAVIKDVKDIKAGKPNADKARHFGMTSYHDRFVSWMSDFPVAMENRWFPGPISHPYPGVSSCRTDPAFQLKPRIPLVGLPDCNDLEDLPFLGSTFKPIYDALPPNSTGIDTDTLESLGIPVPENYSAPSFTGLEDTLGVHMQAFRLGGILFTVCSCEQWVEQSYNIKTRTDTLPGNEWLGYDWTKGSEDLPESVQAASKCTKAGDGTYDDFGRSGTGHWTCPQSGGTKIPDALMQHMRAQVYNDASRWDDPTCGELGCGIQGESEPVDLKKVFGNYTHDDTTVRGGKSQTPEYADLEHGHGYKMTVTISMSNDYNGYIASYRDFNSHDHYRKALTGWGPHSSDYYATRLTRMGHAMKGDADAKTALDEESDATKATPGYLPGALKEVADQAHEEAKVLAVGEIASAGRTAYDLTIPEDGGSATAMVQPKDIERFDAATFTWDGGNNYTDNPDVTVQRLVDGQWVTFADQSGEVPVTLKYPSSDITNIALYRLGGQTWKWTATFEAFVSRFELVDPQGAEYDATPPGTYRFVAKGKMSTGQGASQAYTRTSNPFQVKPWSGITIDNAHLDGAGHVVFDAGPTHTIAEPRVRSTERPDLGVLNVTIGPVDFPDTAKDQAATGARFLNKVRGYSDGTGPTDLEHYCLDCRFRDWLDSTNKLKAVVTIKRAGGATETKNLQSSTGHFATNATLQSGDKATIVIRDKWDDVSGTTATVTAP